MGVESYFIDTNVLLALSDPERGNFNDCREVLCRCESGDFDGMVSGQVYREYHLVATRALTQNGLGLSVDESLSNIRYFQNTLGLLPDDEAVFALVRSLLSLHGVHGKRVHDFNLAATALRHGVTRIITANAKDFRAIKELIAMTPSEFAKQ